MHKTKKNIRGITLIALVVSIILLLILAGVTIAALNGDNGILTKAKEAKEKTTQAQKEEEKTLSNMENTLENLTSFSNLNTAETNPAGAMPSNVEILENDANKGITIKDRNNNEWVWVEVPKITVFGDLTIDTTKELTKQNYTDIKNKLISYVGVYKNGSESQTRSDWTDEWYDGCGIAPEEYTSLFQKMLKSVYTYGGFWIGRYEAGIEGSIDDLSKVRTEHSDIEIGTSPKAISQKDAIPYNYVYCSEAQILAQEMAPDSNNTSSLMFGIQWDLVCKFLEVKSTLETKDINSDSTSWGNYSNAKIENITSGKYAIYNGTTISAWTKISASYTKQNSGDDYKTLLSTGITDYTKKMNIYDLAGNAYEWTLEHATSDSNRPCTRRGSSYVLSGNKNPASYISDDRTTNNDSGLGFRTTFYIK